jgi:hypothetical protein
MTAPGQAMVAVDAACAAPTQSRAREPVPSMDARSMPRFRAREPFRPPARMSARVLPGRARTLGSPYARDDGHSLSGAVPPRCPGVRLATTSSEDVSGHLVVHARTFRDVSGHLAARGRTSPDISGLPRPRRGGFAYGCAHFKGRFGTFSPSAHLCVERVAVCDGGSAGAVA